MAGGWRACGNLLIKYLEREVARAGEDAPHKATLPTENVTRNPAETQMMTSSDVLIKGAYSSPLKHFFGKAVRRNFFLR